MRTTGINYVVLHCFHFPRGCWCSIVKPMQMQECMCDVEAKLSGERIPKRTGLPFRGFDADKDFAVLKREHVGGAALMHEFAV